jgi:hypothetical protein
MYKKSMIKDGLVTKYNIKSKTFDIDFKNGYKMYNPSIVKNNDDTYTLMFRVSNKPLCNLHKRIKTFITSLKNYILLVDLDKNYNILNNEVSFAKSLHFVDNDDNGYGIEDIRGFYYNNIIYFIGTYLKRNKLPTPVIINYKGDITIIKTKDMQKNWSPIILDDKLYFITEHNPFTLAEVNLDTGNFKYVHKSKYNKSLPKLRGNTPYISLGNNKYLGITHTVIDNVGLLYYKNYAHYFTLIEYVNDDFTIKISEPLCMLGDCGIEFVLGLIENIEGDAYIITFGKNDCTSHLVTVPKNIVHSMVGLNI